MPFNYRKTKIFKLVNGNRTFIGASTASTLARVLSSYRNSYKRYKEGKLPTYCKKRDYYDLLDGNERIELITTCSCQDVDEVNKMVM